MKGMKNKMKKTIAIFTVLMITFFIFSFTHYSYAIQTVSNNISTNISNDNALSEKAIDKETESKLIELKDSQTKSLEEYKEKYGSDTYGTVAYILNIVRIYSIPFCFLGIAIGAIHRYVIGVRKLDTLQKGMGFIISFVTLLIVCQVLPLAFAMFVKFGRG